MVKHWKCHKSMCECQKYINARCNPGERNRHTSPPNPWDWLTEPQVKNHCSKQTIDCKISGLCSVGKQCVAYWWTSMFSASVKYILTFIVLIIIFCFCNLYYSILMKQNGTITVDSSYSSLQCHIYILHKR